MHIHRCSVGGMCLPHVLVICRCFLSLPSDGKALQFYTLSLGIGIHLRMVMLRFLDGGALHEQYTL